MDAATIIESESRELIRRRGLNVHADQLEPLIREVMSDYDRRSSSGEVPVLRDDDESMVAEVAARIGGFGPLQEMLDDPSIEEIWLNSPSRAEKLLLQSEGSTPPIQRLTTSRWQLTSIWRCACASR